MARRVFFSFHYEDVLRVNVVRHAETIKKKYVGQSRFYDGSLWETDDPQDDAVVKRRIAAGLENTTVTCVLVGQNTWERPFVRHELLKSFARGNGILGVRIHHVGPEKSKSEPGLGAIFGLAQTVKSPLAGLPNLLDPNLNALTGLSSFSDLFANDLMPPPPPREKTLAELLAAASAPPRNGALNPLSLALGAPPAKDRQLNALAAILSAPSPRPLGLGAVASLLGTPPREQSLAEKLAALMPPPPPPGPNPLDYLAYMFSEDGRKVHLFELDKNNAWVEALDVGPVPTNSLKVSLPPRWGKFSYLYNLYDWKAENGHTNFPSWAETAALLSGK